MVGEHEAGQRLDIALAALSAESRSQIQRWIEAERVRLRGAPGRASQRVALGDEIEAIAPEPVSAALAAEPIPLDVIYEDAELIVVNKTAGMVVHPAPGHLSGTLVNALLYHCGDLAGVGGVLRPGIVHRLDRGTSGIMVAAKRDTAHRALAEQFRSHSIERIYHAFVRGLPRAERGRVDRAIGRHVRDRKRMSVRSASGRSAQTAWRILRRFPASGLSYLELSPETGRTHQIRVHLAWAGMPIEGDPVYGRRREAGKLPALARPALHAASLAFTHPRTGRRLHFEAPLPGDLAELLARIETREGGP